MFLPVNLSDAKPLIALPDIYIYSFLLSHNWTKRIISVVVVYHDGRTPLCAQQKIMGYVHSDTALGPG